MKGNKPIAFRNPELDALGKGLRHFRRLADGALSGVGPGDALWIREPYFLPKRWETFKPTQALALGAEPTFLADVGFRHRIAWLGRVRSARELCRAWHRRHVIVGHVRREPLQAITSDDLAAGGYRDAEHFAELWDRDMSMGGRRVRWHDNPTVLRCSFSLVDRPLPAPPPKALSRPHQPEKPPRGDRREALRQAMLPPVELLPQLAPVPDRTWCDQCQSRVQLEQGRACERRFCPLAAPSLDQEAA